MADAVAAVTAEVEALPPSLRNSGLAITAIVLAERLAAASPRDAAPLGREIRESLAKLQQLATEIPSEEVDPLDALLGGKPHLRVAGA
jgi:hypothetical protein